MSLQFSECHTKIRQVDAHATLSDGVVVQVMGELSNNGQPMRKFMQTFVLAPEVSGGLGYAPLTSPRRGGGGVSVGLPMVELVLQTRSVKCVFHPPFFLKRLYSDSLKAYYGLEH